MPDHDVAGTAADEVHKQRPQDDKHDPDRPQEFGGRKKGLDPTRYGDWEKDGRCIDF